MEVVDCRGEFSLTPPGVGGLLQNTNMKYASHLVSRRVVPVLKFVHEHGTRPQHNASWHTLFEREVAMPESILESQA